MLVLISLFGCSAWIDQEPACDQDVYAWSDDLLAYVLTGDGSGEFDLEPEDDYRDAIEGDYSPNTGDFAWETDYASGYYLVRQAVTGFGTVYHNGDLDLLYTSTITDMLGDSWANKYRVQRSGCDMTIGAWDAEADIETAAIQEGSYADDSVWSWAVAGSGFSWTGSLRDDLTRTQIYELDDGSAWSLTSAQADGTTNLQSNFACDDYYCEQVATRGFDGGFDGTLDVYDGDDLYYDSAYNYNYDGSGVETQTYYVDGDEVVCEFTIEANGACEYDCDNGEGGDCSG
jgi:hypothetical protein